ncbi:MAG: efflux RND transporter permease subunit [Bdellovibrionales bacterium]|nr:efflux RND transporter permease subunit [Bdellovibrionales bacterium]
MFLSKLPEHGVNNKLLVNLISALLVLAGILTVASTQREAFPNVSFDTVMIQTNYPGATPKEIETLITNKIEDELETVNDIKDITSVSAEGYSLITVVFEADVKNTDKLINDIQQAVDRVDDFPSDLEKPPFVREMNTKDSPVIEVALSGNLTRKELQEYGKSLELQLQDIPQVSKVARSGWKDEQVWVEADAKKLEKFKVSLDQISDALRLRNINLPGGNLKSNHKEFLVRTDAEFKTLDEIKEIVIRANQTGQVVRIKDVATVQYGFDDSSSSVELRPNGAEGFTLTVIKKESADIIKLVDRIEDVIDNFQKIAPDTLHITLINDVSFWVKRRLGILLKNGAVGLLFVLISLIIFLSPPVAFWTAVGLPVASALGIWAMSYFGINVHLISMFALIMVMGMLVDDAIIVAENVYRKMEEGMSPKEAAIVGTREVIKPVSTAILTSVLVFVPLAFMTGIFGKFVFAIPIVVILMLMASWIESMWILPTHLAEFEKVTKFFLERDKKRRANNKSSLIEVLKKRYGKFLQRILPYHTMIAQIFYVLIIAAIYIGIKTTPVNLFPGKGIEIFFVRGECELGTPLSATKERLIQLEKYVKEIPSSELKDFITIIGKMENEPNDPFAIRNTHVGQIAVYLTPDQKRDRSAKEIMDELRDKIKHVEGFKRVWLDEVNPGPPQGKPVAIRVRGDDLETIYDISKQVEEKVRSLPGVIDIRNDYEQGKDEIVVKVNESMVAQASLHATQIARIVRTSFEGEIATEIREGDEDINVIVRLNEKDRSNQDIFKKLYVQNPAQRMIPIQNTVMIQARQGINSIKHFDGKRTISVTADLEEDKTSSLEVNTALEKPLSEITQNYPGYSIRYGGEYEDTQESLNSLIKAFVIAIFFIFVVLASAFNSMGQPFLIMLAIPFSLFSAIYALKFHGEPFSFLAILGMIGLSGVSVNDSIVLIDFMNQKVEEGKDHIASVIEACQTRLRPVILTSITTVVGLAPVAYGIGGSDPFLKPMALAMAWGLALGTILILFLIPNAYLSVKKHPFASVATLFSPLVGIGIFQSLSAPIPVSGTIALAVTFAIPYLAYLIRKMVQNFIYFTLQINWKHPKNFAEVLTIGILALIIGLILFSFLRIFLGFIVN